MRLNVCRHPPIVLINGESTTFLLVLSCQCFTDAAFATAGGHKIRSDSLSTWVQLYPVMRTYLCAITMAVCLLAKLLTGNLTPGGNGTGKGCKKLMLRRDDQFDLYRLAIWYLWYPVHESKVH